MVKILTFIGVLLAVNIGLAIAFQPIDTTTHGVVFTGGPGFPPIDKTTIMIKFTGQ